MTDHINNLTAHLTAAAAGDTQAHRLAVRLALRLGLVEADADDLGLVLAVVVERIGEVDDDGLAAVYGASHRETIRRVNAPAMLAR